VYVKAIQLSMDEKLLAALDADEEVRRLGRSAVLRKIAAEYLDRRRRSAVRSQYQKAYGRGGGLGNEYAGWEDQGVWPEE
jgi:metal-responsive CopG/Arc/MetJ family transcriptional regulator